MSRFLAPSEFIDRIGEREAASIAGTGGFNTLEGRSIDIDEVTRELNHAEDLVSGYVLGQHPWLRDTDIADVPDLLKGFTSDITRYRLRDKAGNAGQITETVETRYRDAIKMLQDIQRGKLDLIRVGSAAGDPPEAINSDERAQISGPAPTVDATLKGWM